MAHFRPIYCYFSELFPHLLSCSASGANLPSTSVVAISGVVALSSALSGLLVLPLLPMPLSPPLLCSPPLSAFCCWCWTNNAFVVGIAFFGFW